MMKKIYSFLALVSLTITVNAQLSGTKTIKASGGDYPTFSAAIGALNANGVAAPGVTFDVDPGFVSIEETPAITTTGTAAAPIVFRKAAAGINPVLKPTGTAASTDWGFKITGADYITFDGIDVNINSGNATEFGFLLETSGSLDGASNNTIKNCAVSLNKTNTASIGIKFNSLATATSGANMFNKIYNISVSNCYNGIFLNGNSTYPDSANSISTINAGSSIFTNLGGGTIACYSVQASNQKKVVISNCQMINYSTTSNTVYGINQLGSASSSTISNNIIQNISTTGTGTAFGINISAGAVQSIFSNTVSGISSAGPAQGINIGASNGNDSAYDNVVKQVTSSTSAANSSLYHAYGINIASLPATANVFRNTVSEITYNGNSTANAIGINFGSGGTSNVYNNMVADIKAPLGTAVAAARGIALSNGIAQLRIYYNTVYLPASTNAITSAALYTITNQPNIDIRNNIFVNNNNVTAGTRAAAHWRTTTTLTNLDVQNDNNLYYAGVPGAKNVIYYDGTNAYQTITDYKNQMGVREQYSITELPAFVSAVSPYDLHLSGAVPTQCESAGLPVNIPLAVTADFDGSNRSLSNTDIGADEGSFISQDLTGPYIKYTPLINTTLGIARTLTAAITDISGVPVSGVGLPVLYWRKNADPVWSSVTGTYTSGSNYTFTFGAGTVLNDSISYYIAAQDQSSTPNPMAKPSAGTAGYSINPPAVSTTPTLASYYKIVNGLPAVVNVGTGETYTSLTGPYPRGLFASINNGIVNTNIQVNITSNLTEDGSSDLKQWVEESGSNFNITIAPGSASTKLISGAVANSMIRLNGVKRLTIDGSFAESGNYLTFRNTDLIYPTVNFLGDASGNTIRNCTLEGSSTADQLAVVLFSQGISTGNDNNLITNNIIRDRSDATGVPANLVYAVGPSAAATNSNNILSNNQLMNFRNSAFRSRENNENWTISQNDITQSTSQAGDITVIDFGSKGDNLITQNNIHNIINNGGAVNVTGLIILQNAGNTTVSRNRLYGIPGGNTTLYGIALWGSSGNPVTVTAINNQISLAPTSTSNQPIVGILSNGYTGNTMNILNNSVFIGGSSNGTYNTYACQYQPIAGSSNNVIRNNIFYNNRLSASNNFALAYEDANGAGSFKVSNNFNCGRGITADAFMSYSNGLATPTTFAAWAGTLHDISSYGITAGSFAANSLFTDTLGGNLDIVNNNTSCWYVSGKGLPLTGIADDYGSTAVRSTLLTTGSVDIGSDEFNTSLLPPDLTPAGNHDYGQTETFSFAGKKIASITWGNTGTLPTLGNAKHYTGVWPNDTTNNGTISGAKYLNEWWHIPASGGTGYTYNMTLYYDSAMLGTIVNEPLILMDKKVAGVPGTWITTTATVVNTSEKILDAANFSSFSEFTGSQAAGTVPVSLLSFTAAADKKDVKLNWKVTEEINHSYYEVQRSTDGAVFTGFVTVAGRGNYSGNIEYTATDNNALLIFSARQKLFYRLKLVSVSGQVTYSPIAIVRLNGNNNALVSIWPNPASNVINISSGFAFDNIQLINTNGQVVSSWKPAPGQRYPVADLPAGIYLLKLSSAEKVQTEKILIQK